MRDKGSKGVDQRKKGLQIVNKGVNSSAARLRKTYQNMARIPPFDPADLRPIRTLHEEGKFGPLKLRRVLKLCARRQFPAVKISNTWHTTEAAIRGYVWDHLTPDFKKITS